MLRLSFALALGAALLTGCVVEPRKVDRPSAVDASTPDTGVSPDSGADAGLSCQTGEVTCDDGEYCTDAGVCAPIPATCETTSDCAPRWACDDGRCVTPGRACADATECAGGEVCMAAGWCAPGLVSVSPDVTTCRETSDCGPGGICTRGRCVPCSETTRCPGGLTCDDDTGECVETYPCTREDDCFEGNTCRSGVCVRSTVGCLVDGDGDEREGAKEIVDALYDDLSICGDDLDYYTLDVPEGFGVIVTVTSTRATGSIDAFLVDANDLYVDRVASLTLPGVSIDALSVDNEARAIWVGVQSLDQSTAYTLDVRLVAGYCAGDALDLYGDADPARAVLVPTESTIPLVMCSRDEDLVAVDVLEGDTITVSSSFAGGADLDLEVLDANGTTLARGESTSTSTESVSSGALAAGRVLVRVTSKRAASAGTDYTLAITRTLGARQRACDAPGAVLSPANPSITGVLSAASDVGAPACSRYAESARHDLVYRIDPPSGPSLLTIDARQTGGVSTSTLTLALLSACTDDASFFACEASPRPYRAASIVTELASDTPIFVMVSSDGAAEDVTFEVLATFEPLTTPTNDQCARAIDLGATSTTTPAATWAANDDARLESSGVCGIVGSGSGPERFYTLSLAAQERAALEVRGQGAYLWVATDCEAMTRTCVASGEVRGVFPGKVVLAPAQATNYVVAVDGVGAGSVGAYTLRTVRGADLACVTDAECGAGRACDDYRCASAPENDVCPGSVVTLVDGLAVLEGSTGAARDELVPGCAVSRGIPDVVYRVEVPAGAGALTARITSADWDPVLAIRRGSCTSVGAEVDCNDDVRAPDLLWPEVSVRSPAADTYYIVVDGYEGRGRFTLEVALTP